MKELTKGYPARVIMMFAIPLMCGSIFQQLYNMADSKIVSTYVGTVAFAAVGTTGVISNMLIGFINGLTQGFAILVANCFGAQKEQRMRQYVAGTVLIVVIVTVVLTALSLTFIEPILNLLNTPDDVMPYAVSYVKIILSGIVFTSLYNMCANILRAVGDSRTPLYCLMAAVLLNLGLDILFVKGFNWQIEGAAYATVIAQAFSGFLCLGYILIKFRMLIPGKDEWKLTFSQYSSLISTGLAMGLMSCIVNIGTIVLQGAINSLGTGIVAAHTAARRVFDILTVGLYNVGLAITTYVSQNMGAGEYGRVRQGVRHALYIVTVISTLLIVICFVFSRPIMMWLTSSDEPEIINAAVMYSKISISFFYILGPLFVLRCALQGMGRKIIPVCSSILEMIIKILSAMLLVPEFAYVGVAFTEPLSWTVMTILLAAAYFSKPIKVSTE